MERGPVDAGAGGDGVTSGQTEGYSCLETDAVLPLLLISAWQRRLQFRGPINRAHYIHSHAGSTQPRLSIAFRYKKIIESDVQAACFPFRARLFTS